MAIKRKHKETEQNLSYFIATSTSSERGRDFREPKLLVSQMTSVEDGFVLALFIGSPRVWLE